MKSAQYLLLSLFFFILQSSSFPIIPGVDWRPDMALVLVVHFALAFGRVGGMTFGAAAGLFHDLLLCGTVGQGVLSWGLVGYASGALRESYISDTLFTRVGLVAAATVADIIVKASMARMVYGEGVGPALAALGPQILANAVFAILAMPLLIWLDAKVGGAQERGDKKRKLESFLTGMRSTR
ncbi:MAG: rod shape-determining protein MreD [Nitrospinota bacterium]|nr:rod shape-determining protein MreD [Nitrospinota bacterium]MDH5677773.1 rod shape-determining protein MreD [Nitrospinota bacterium]